MNAIVLHEYGGPEQLRLEQVDDPKPGPGEVLVRLSATSVNPFDWKVRSGAMKDREPLNFPAILGRDIAGTVTALGPNAEGFTVGDLVVGLGWHAYAELVAVKAADLAEVPDGLGMVQAAALPLVTITGEQLISRGAKAKKGRHWS